MVPSLVVSGQHTEPLLYPDIGALIGLLSRKDALLGLYTNGTFDLGPMIADLFRHPESYVVLNLPASSVSAISKVAGITQAVASESVRAVTQNLTLMAAYQKAVSSAVQRIHVNYEIIGARGFEEEIHDLLSFLTQFDAPISVRLTCPVTPLHQLESPNAFVSQLKLGVSKTQSALGAWRAEFDGTNLTIWEYFDHHRSNPFDQCFAMFDTMVVRADGGVFPCCYTANPTYDAFVLGNIAESNYTTLRNNHSRLKLFESLDPKRGCPVCSKKDHQINERSQHIVCP
jgi:radical SAM protein with 4Fe4S-binding SPASM domain